VPVLETDDVPHRVRPSRFWNCGSRSPPFGGNPPEALTRCGRTSWRTTALRHRRGPAQIADSDHVLGRSLPADPALVARGGQRTEQFFDRVEQQLLKNQHLAGGGFSFADISLLVAVDFAGWVEISPAQGRPALKRWYERVAARPSAGA
jgi:glutathione S-transferase